jgi:hypothetical protein
VPAGDGGKPSAMRSDVRLALLRPGARMREANETTEKNLLSVPSVISCKKLGVRKSRANGVWLWGLGAERTGSGFGVWGGEPSERGLALGFGVERLVWDTVGRVLACGGTRRPRSDLRGSNFAHCTPQPEGARRSNLGLTEVGGLYDPRWRTR